MPSNATARVRGLSRGGLRKNDRIDAVAAVCVAFSQGDFRPVAQEGHTDVLRMILARTGNPTRFASEAAYASYTGAAPVEVASANKQRHRLSRRGDRTLNAAIHIVAVTQTRTPSGDGYTYHQRKMAEGKTSREAMRCLKQQVAKRLWRTMRDDQIDRVAARVAA